METPSQDLKRDAGKLRFDLVCPYAELGLAMVLTAGALKYGPDGWLGLEGERWRIDAALARHRNQMRRGEAIDPEFGLPHAVHLLANAMFEASFAMRELAREGKLDAVRKSWSEALLRLSLRDAPSSGDENVFQSLAKAISNQNEIPAGSGPVADERRYAEPQVQTQVFSSGTRSIGGVRTQAQ